MNYYDTTTIEARAAELLGQTQAFRIPIPVDRVARRAGLRVEAVTLGEDVSGVLVIDGGKGTIGYNNRQAYVRQRFTIAHELGHYILHSNDDQLFIDRGYAAVYRRDQQSSSGEYLREIEANQFAAALLMPQALVLEAIRKLDFDLGDELALDSLAEEFQVSRQAMSLRLSNLGIFSGYVGQ